MKKKEEKIERLNLVLRAIRNVNQLLIREKDRTRLVQGACDNLIENRGYYNAWIALLDESGRLVTSAESGLGKEFLPMVEQLKRGAMTECGQKALNQSRLVLTQDPFSDCKGCPLSQKYAGRGAITVRLKHGEKIRGILCVSIPREVVPDEEEHGLLEEIAGDIAFGLHTIELEEKQNQAEETLRESEKRLSEIVQASSIPTFVIDNKHIITHWNRACENLTRISSNEIIGTQKQWSAFYSEERPVMADLIVNDAKEKEIANYYGEKYRKSDIIEGGYEGEDFFPDLGEGGKWLFFTAAPLADAEGKVIGAIETLQDISEGREIQEALQETTQELGERLKELNCLYAISSLVEERGISLEEIFQGTVDLIPPAWQYPEITCAQIIFEGQEFKTLNFKETRWMQASDVIVYGEQKGSVEVAYLDERPESDEGPFLKEERNLINAIAERLGRIIERKRTEKAIIESEETLREAQEIAHLGNWEYDIGRDRVTFSDELYRIYGVKPSDRPLTYERLLEYVHPEDREYHNTVTELLRKEGAAQFEYRVLRPDGNMRWVWGRGQVTYDKAGVPLRMFGTVQDITGRRRAEEALRESEKRFRDLIENSLIGTSIVQDDQVIYQNPEQERLLGPLPRPPKLTEIENIHPDDVGKVKEFYENMISGEVQMQETEFRFFPVDESDNRLEMKWVHCRTSSIEYRGREAILVNMMDVTRTKELENILRIQDKMSSLGRVAAGIAHEIRNPLSGINIYLGTLEKMYDKEDNSEKVKQIFGQLKSASDKIESVIRRVMDFSKPGEPKLVLTDINEPIEEAIDLSSVTLRKRGIKLEKTLAGNLQPCPADPHLIEQVILNLITNAAEAMKNLDGAKVIEVTSYMENNRVIVRVSDSGPGVPLHIREKIFDPFYTTKNSSTGIGLSLSHRIITDHGGSLNVYPSKQGGAEFRIEIPTKTGIDQT